MKCRAEVCVNNNTLSQGIQKILWKTCYKNDFMMYKMIIRKK